MSWNNGYERKKFEKRMKAQEERYRKIGVNEKIITEIYKFDLGEFKSERIYRMHTQPFVLIEYDTDNANSLHNNFLDEMESSSKMISGFSFGWIEDINNDILYDALYRLNDSEKELLTYIYVFGYTAEEVSKDIYKCKTQTIYNKLSRIYEKISKFFFEKEGLKDE